MKSPLDPGARPVLVFSHPNHELAVWGLVQRVRPHFVFLTDGGGPDREAETREGLERLDLLGCARFLGHGEQDLYGALLDRDLGFLRELGRQLRTELERVDPTHLLGDAVELYNPVHDLTRPLLAFASRGEAPIFEVPLIYQRPEDREHYEVQRFPAERPGPRLRLSLSEAELEAKLAARDEVYSLLRAQLGPLLFEPEARFAREEIAPVHETLTGPGEGCALRYERRGELLHRQGQVKAVITHAHHYVPIARALMEAA